MLRRRLIYLGSACLVLAGLLVLRTRLPQAPPPLAVSPAATRAADPFAALDGPSLVKAAYADVTPAADARALAEAWRFADCTVDGPQATTACESKGTTLRHTPFGRVNGARVVFKDRGIVFFSLHYAGRPDTKKFENYLTRIYGEPRVEADIRLPGHVVAATRSWNGQGARYAITRYRSNALGWTGAVAEPTGKIHAPIRSPVVLSFGQSPETPPPLRARVAEGEPPTAGSPSAVSPRLPDHMYLGKVLTPEGLLAYTSLGGDEYLEDGHADPVSELTRWSSFTLNPETNVIYRLHVWQAYPTALNCLGALRAMQEKLQLQYSTVVPMTGPYSFSFQDETRQEQGACRAGADGRTALHRELADQGVAPPVVPVPTDDPVRAEAEARAVIMESWATLGLTPHTPYRQACEEGRFPGHWEQAETYVDILQAMLRRTERTERASRAQRQAFQRSLDTCNDQVRREFTGSGGSLTLLRCRARTICGRLSGLDMS